MFRLNPIRPSEIKRVLVRFKEFIVDMNQGWDALMEIIAAKIIKIKVLQVVRKSTPLKIIKKFWNFAGN